MATPDTDDASLAWVTKTVVVVDVVESVRLFDRDEAAQIARLRQLLRTFERRQVPDHGGVVLERRGDGLLAAFDDARRAAAAARDMHQAAAGVVSAGGVPDDRLCLRIGIHSARFVLDAGAAYGHGVNVAARIMALAQPGQTLVTEAVRDALNDPLDGTLRDLGLCHLKHLSHPVRAFELQPTAAAALPRTAGESRSAIAAPAATGLPGPASIRTRLAVLPLEPPSGRAAPPSTDVLHEQWTTALSTSPLLQVTSRMSSLAFKGRSVAPQAAGRLLGVDFVLCGRFDPIAPGTLDLELSLTHVDSGDSIWQGTVVTREADGADAQSPAVAGVIDAVFQALMVTESRVARVRPLPNLALHTLHLTAVNQLHCFVRDEFNQAHALLQELRNRVPRHATPLAWLARWHVFRIVQGWSDSRDHDASFALEYANRALEIDPHSSLALSMAGSVQAGVQLDMAAARSYYDQALERNPNEPLAWLLKGVAHGFMGEGDAALQASERSLQLSPLDPMRYYFDSLSSAAAMGARRFERAVELAERAIRANCMHGSAYRTLAIAQAMLGRESDARLTVQRLLAIEPGSSVRQFVARAAVDSVQNREFARALAVAGLPSG